MEEPWRNYRKNKWSTLLTKNCQFSCWNSIRTCNFMIYANGFIKTNFIYFQHILWVWNKILSTISFFRSREFFQWSRWRNRPWATTLTPSDGDNQLTAEHWTAPWKSKQKRTYIQKPRNDFTVIKKAMTSRCMLQMFIYKYGSYKQILKPQRTVQESWRCKFCALHC